MRGDRMILEDGKIINVNKVSFFGRNAVAKQISPHISNDIDGFYDDYNNFEKISKTTPLIYAVGYNNLKKKYQRLESLIKENYRVCSFVANNSIISNSIIGNGVIINSGVIIDNFVEIHNGVFINIGSRISHHSIIGSCSFIGPGVTIAGNVLIGECAFIGAGTTIINDVKIGKGSIIAAGTVITKDVPEYTLVAGVPGKVKKDLTKE
jgi:UDP-N-acetylbacillosamine N-acetyltransferase